MDGLGEYDASVRLYTVDYGSGKMGVIVNVNLEAWGQGGSCREVHK